MPTNKHQSQIIKDQHDETNLAQRVNLVAGSLATVDIQIGAVELKDGTSNARAKITAGGDLKALATVTQSGVVNSLATAILANALQTGTNYIGLATVDIGSIPEVSALATITPSGPIDVEFPSGATVAVSKLPIIPTGANYIGLATVDIGSIPEIGALATITPSGSVSVAWESGATVAVSNLPNVTIGAELPTGANWLGLATVWNTNSQVTVYQGGAPWSNLATITNFPASQTVDWLSGATVAVSNLPDVTLGAGTAGIGFATVATDIAKAEDTSHSSGDKGVMALAVRKDDVGRLTGADGDYNPLIVNEDGILRTQAQQHLHIDEFAVVTGWSVLNSDVTSLATTTNHVMGEMAVEFDKLDGAADSVLGGIEKTLSDLPDFDAYEKGNGFFLWSLYVSSVADVAYVFLRLGTDASNYNEWRIDDDDLSAGWNPLRMPLHRPSAVQGAGWNSAVVTYGAVGVALDSEDDELVDIAVDHLSINTGLQTSADITAEITTAASTPNVRLIDYGGSVDTDIGVAGSGVLRIAQSSDQFGEVQETPTENTLLARIKELVDGQLADNHNVTVSNELTALATVTQGGTVTTDWASGATVAVSNLPATPAGANYIGLATVDIGSIPEVNALATVTQGGTVTVDWSSGATVAVGSLPDVDINDISKGTQTNDVKVTLDSEAVVLGAGAAWVGLATVWNANSASQATVFQGGAPWGSLATVNNWPSSQTVDWSSGATVAVSALPAIPTGANYIGLATVDVGTIPEVSALATVTQAGTVTTDWASGATVAVSNLPDVTIGTEIPAGTKYIGLATVDIGSAPTIAITDTAIDGPGQPDIDSYTHASINLAAGAEQVLVSSAASKQIWVYGIGFTVNVKGTVSFQDEDDTAITGIMNIEASSGMAIPPSGNFAMPIWKLGTDKDLEVDIVTSELDGWIDYAVVSV